MLIFDEIKQLGVEKMRHKFGSNKPICKLYVS